MNMAETETETETARENKLCEARRMGPVVSEKEDKLSEEVQ